MKPKTRIYKKTLIVLLSLFISGLSIRCAAQTRCDSVSYVDRSVVVFNKEKRDTVPLDIYIKSLNNLDPKARKESLLQLDRAIQRK